MQKAVDWYMLPSLMSSFNQTFVYETHSAVRWYNLSISTFIVICDVTFHAHNLFISFYKNLCEYEPIRRDIIA